MEEEKTIQVELVTYSCGYCGGDKWKLMIGYASDGRTLLVITCANEDCVKARKEALGMSEDQPIFWDELDITGQGHDPEDGEAEGKVMN